MKRTLILTAAIVFLTGIAHAAPIQWDVNNHWYDVVWVEAGLDWEDARDLAEARGGHLVTLTSEAENLFVWNFLLANLADGTEYKSYWLGGYQQEEYRSGPPAEGWGWVTGEAWDYTNWHPSEPNNGMGGTQHYLHYWDTDSGHWDDMDNGRYVGGFVIEYANAPNPVPEPGTLLLLGSGLIGLAGLRRRFSKSK